MNFLRYSLINFCFIIHGFHDLPLVIIIIVANFTLMFFTFYSTQMFFYFYIYSIIYLFLVIYIYFYSILFYLMYQHLTVIISYFQFFIHLHFLFYSEVVMNSSIKLIHFHHQILDKIETSFTRNVLFYTIKCTIFPFIFLQRNIILLS